MEARFGTGLSLSLRDGLGCFGNGSESASIVEPDAKRLLKRKGELGPGERAELQRGVWILDPGPGDVGEDRRHALHESV